MRKSNPRLSDERALYLAGYWGRQNAAGRVELCSDPAHKLVNPVQYQLEEAMACWRSITAPVLWVDGADSKVIEHLRIDAAEFAARKACFAKLTAHIGKASSPKYVKPVRMAPAPSPSAPPRRSDDPDVPVATIP